MIKIVIRDYENIYNFILEKIKEYYNKPQYDDNDSGRRKGYFMQEMTYNVISCFDGNENDIEIRVSELEFLKKDCSRLLLYVDGRSIFSFITNEGFIIKLNETYVIAEPTSGIYMLRNIEVNEEEINKHGIEINRYTIDIETEDIDIYYLVQLYSAIHNFLVQKLKKQLAFGNFYELKLNQYSKEFDAIKIIKYYDAKDYLDLSTEDDIIIKNGDNVLVKYELENSVFTKIPFSDENVYALCKLAGIRRQKK